ncbi:MAG: hypothetical protein EA381_17685 [Planctomycetaceae bacterium]|nr:MAG: hypothetical protein EA381_17685 [Planctomycetaceae bacterium]
MAVLIEVEWEKGSDGEQVWFNDQWPSMADHIVPTLAFGSVPPQCPCSATAVLVIDSAGVLGR